MNKNKKETRNIQHKVEIRAAQENQDGTATLEGYIAKFNSPTILWDGYVEQIDPHAFDKTISDGHNVFLLYAHDWTKPLASTGAGTLILNADNIGLHFIATVDTSISYIKDVVGLVKNGLAAGCSFGFWILNDNEVFDASTQTYTDTLLEIQMDEGSILSNPAYSDTSVIARAKDKVEELRKKKNEEILELLEIELEL